MKKAIPNEMRMVSPQQYQRILDTPCVGKRFVGEIDGRKVSDLDEFLSEVWRVFRFPYPEYVNYSGYYDWICDLDWLDSDEYIFAILNYGEFMRNDDHWRKIFIEGLQDTVLPWWESDVTQCCVEGKPKPFNVFLVDDCFYGDVELAELFASRESGFSPTEATDMLFYVLQSANPDKLEMTKYFVEEGADVNAVRFGESALTQNFATHKYANDSERRLANEQQYETMLYLIQNGAALEIDGAKWDDILVRASACGNMRAVEYILTADIVDVDHAGVSGDNALIMAAKMGYGDVVRFLLDNGANASAENLCGRMPIEYARWSEDEDIVRMLEGA